MNLDQLPSLPIREVISDLRSILDKTHELVLEAPPGAGKTTLVPLALINASWRNKRKIIMLEPRRMAAKNAAVRMAQLLGESVGQRVGYTIRLEQKKSPQTVIEVVTEGVLTRRLQHDPELEDTALVIFDEFHERNIHSDLGLALCLQSREIFRDAQDPLKLLVMSATLDASPVADLLSGAPKITSKGRAFPVDIIYSAQNPTRETLISEMTNTVVDALTRHSGDVLVFLPGQKEINLLNNKLQARLSKQVVIMPLHGNLSLTQQQAAITPNKDPDLRKVVLATDIAESSLTIEGVKVVIDSGFARKPQFNSRTGMTSLHTVRISQASAKQRAGRAGRLNAGVCYRMWNESQQATMLEHSIPEILQADLAPLAVQLLQWGVEPTELQWLDAPPAAAYQQALMLLQQLGALVTHQDIQLTDHGEAMAALPTHPRLAHMLLIGKKTHNTHTAACVAALLGERNPLPNNSADLETTLDVILGKISCPGNAQAWLTRITQQVSVFKQTLNLQTHMQDQLQSQQANPDALGMLVASAFPDRIARKRSNSRHLYQLANGRAARLSEQDPLSGTEWLAIAEVGGLNNTKEDRIFAATALNPALFESHLADLIDTRKVIEWQRQKLVAEQRSYLGSLIINKRTLDKVSKEDCVQATLHFIREQGLQVLPWDEDLEQFRARVTLVKQHQTMQAWPDLSDAALLDDLENWLAPNLINVASLSALKKLDLKAILLQLLPWPLPNDLEQLAPQRVTVPSGSKLAIDYRQAQPVLEVKLQEMFGCTSTPTVVNGKVPLLIHLLSPARRPLQITQDLAGFWESSYQDIKKEMKGRYPKHPWPDDPYEAVATRLTKKKMQK